MKVLLNIKDGKADFVMELLHNLSFVKMRKLTDEKAQLMDEMKEAVEEMKLIRARKKSPVTLKILSVSYNVRL